MEVQDTRVRQNVYNIEHVAAVIVIRLYFNVSTMQTKNHKFYNWIDNLRQKK